MNQRTKVYHNLCVCVWTVSRLKVEVKEWCRLLLFDQNEPQTLITLAVLSAGNKLFTAPHDKSPTQL